MFDHYQQIFNIRGQAYHIAMAEFPDARQQEFRHFVDIAELASHHLVCDLPCGGNYLRPYLPAGVRVIGVDASAEFFNAPDWLTPPDHSDTVLSSITQTGLQSAQFDRVLSLAGVHHMPDKRPFFSEIARLLKSDGKFCLADVVEGSGTSIFLDSVVDRYNSMGHQGDYLNDATIGEMRACGLTPERVETIDYFWEFADTTAMTTFCRKLFGLDQFEQSGFLAAIEACVPPRYSATRCLLPWQLRFIVGTKS